MIPVVVKSVWMSNICFAKVATILLKFIDRLPEPETTEGGAFLNMVFITKRSKRLIKTFTPQIAKYGIDIQIVRLEMTKFKMFREKVNMDFYFVGITF